MSKLLSKFQKNVLTLHCFYNLARRNLSHSPDTKITKIPVENAYCFVAHLFRKLGVDKGYSDIMADVVIEADKRGNYPHGIFSLPKYIEMVEAGTVDVKARPKVIRENNSTALVCGANALGPIVGNCAMDIAMKKASKTGAACVCAYMSSYFGMAGYYSLKAVNNSMLGMTMSNTPPLMVPLNGMCPQLGANAFSFAINGTCCDVFALDIATTTLSREHIEWIAMKGDRLPPNVALNEKGNETKDPKVALKLNRLLPFSPIGAYGLSAAIEILAGCMSGANYSQLFEQRKDSSDPFNIGHFFLALNPFQFNRNCEDNFTNFFNTLRDIPPICHEDPVRIPGDESQCHELEASCRGIPYNETQICILRQIAIDYNLKDLNDYIS